MTQGKSAQQDLVTFALTLSQGIEKKMPRLQYMAETVVERIDQALRRSAVDPILVGQLLEKKQFYQGFLDRYALLEPQFTMARLELLRGATTPFAEFLLEYLAVCETMRTRLQLPALDLNELPEPLDDLLNKLRDADRSTATPLPN